MSTHRPAHPYEDAMEQIVSTIVQIPFRGLVHVAHEPTSTDDPEDFIIDLAAWLANYRTIIIGQSDNFARTARRLQALEDQRASIRSFFGTLGDDA